MNRYGKQIYLFILFFVAVLCTAYAQISEGVGSVIIKQTGGRNASFTGNIEVGGVASVASLIVNGTAITGNGNGNGGGSDTVATLTVHTLESDEDFQDNGIFYDGIYLRSNLTFLPTPAGVMSNRNSIGVADTPYCNGSRIYFNNGGLMLYSEANSSERPAWMGINKWSGVSLDAGAHGQMFLFTDQIQLNSSKNQLLYFFDICHDVDTVVNTYTATINGEEKNYTVEDTYFKSSELKLYNNKYIYALATETSFLDYEKIIGLNKNQDIVIYDSSVASASESVPDLEDGSRLQVHGSMSADGVRLVPGSGPATTTVPLGYVYLDSTDSKMKVYTSSGWKTLKFED